MMIPELIGVKVLPGGRNTSDWYQSINFILFHTVENVIPLDEHITVSITIHSIIFSLLDAYYRLKSIAHHSCNSLKKIILFIFWWNPFGVTPSVWDDNKSERLARAVKDIRGCLNWHSAQGKSAQPQECLWRVTVEILYFLAGSVMHHSGVVKASQRRSSVRGWFKESV